MRFPTLMIGIGTLALLAAGCVSGPEPRSPAAPAAQAGSESSKPEAGPTPGDTGPFRVGASDSVGATAGSPDAQFRYRFRQIDPGSEKFTFQDRDLSFYFRPSPDALHFQIENRQNRPVWIEWDRSQVFDPLGGSDKIAHASTRWVDRTGVQNATQIMGLQRYGDYLLPIGYLLDPGGSDDQIHRPFFPENESAPQYDGREFGVNLVIRVENQLRTYPFRFRVASVLPR